MHFHQDDLSNHRGRVLTLMLSKFLHNTLLRAPYLISSFLADDFGMDQSTVNVVLTMQEISTFTSAALSPLGDKVGALNLVAVAQCITMFSNLLLGLAPSTAFFIGLARFIFGFGYSFTFSQVQSYVVQVTSFENLDKVTGFLEISWAFSTLIGTPLVALIFNLGWRWCFIIPSLCFIPLFIAQRAMLVATPKETELQVKEEALAKPKEALSVVLKRAFSPMAKILSTPHMIYALLVMMTLSGSVNLVFVNISPLLSDTFGLSEYAVGVASMFFGAAEITGTMFVAHSGTTTSTDQKVLITKALCGNLIALVLLAIFGTVNVYLTLAILVLLFSCNECTVIAGISWSSAMFPEAPGAYMTLVVASMAVSRSIAAFTAYLIFQAGSTALVGSVAAFIILIAIALLHISEAKRATHNASEDLDSDAAPEVALEETETSVVAAPTADETSA